VCAPPSSPPSPEPPPGPSLLRQALDACAVPEAVLEPAIDACAALSVPLSVALSVHFVRTSMLWTRVSMDTHA